MSRRLRFVVFILLVACAYGVSPGQVVRGGDCVVYAETPEPPECAFASRNGQLYLSQKYVGLYFKASRSRLAPIFLSKDGWAYINREGRVVVRYVAPYDNWASEFHSGW